jgi:ankyrin repeat protein
MKNTHQRNKLRTVSSLYQPITGAWGLRFLNKRYENNGDTPLLRSLYWHDINLAMMLLDKGALPYITNDDGFTALHVAVFLFRRGTTYRQKNYL